MKLNQQKQKTSEWDLSVLTWFLQLVLLLVVGGSIWWTLQSDQHALRQFVSFAVTFMVLGLIFWPLTKPLRE